MTSLVQEYTSGATTIELGARYGVNPQTIANRLKKAGATLRPPRGRGYPVREGAFAAPITDEAAYWVGFLLADGSILPEAGKAPRLEVLLSEKDRGHLVKLRSFLGLTRSKIGSKTVTVKGKKYQACRLAVRNRRLCQDLARYNVVPNKETQERTPSELAGNPHFWRGVVDGDGCIYVGCAKSLSLVGSQNVLEHFKSFARSDSSVLPVKGKKCLQFFTTGAEAIRTARRLYSRPGPSLDRKAAKARQLMEVA